MTEPREKGWVSMGLPEPGPVRGMRGVVGLLLVDDLVGAWVGCGLMMGSIVFCVRSLSSISQLLTTESSIMFHLSYSCHAT